MPSRSTTLTDHEEIRRWAEERGAKPAAVRRTGKGEDPGIIRLDFPGYSGGDSLEELSWEEFFQKFDENNLALIVQQQTSRGQRSNFNKLISRASVQGGKSSKGSSRGRAGSTSSSSSRSRTSSSSRSRTSSRSRSGGRSSSDRSTSSRGRSASSRSGARSASSKRTVAGGRSKSATSRSASGRAKSKPSQSSRSKSSNRKGLRVVSGGRKTAARGARFSNRRRAA